MKSSGRVSEPARRTPRGGGGGGGEEKKKMERFPISGGTIDHCPLRGRCPKRREGRDEERKEEGEDEFREE